ncbi:hypothetical protein ABZ407_30370 [Streptomyces tibetensis]
MATAPPPLRTTVGNLCLGSAPDSWGVWFPEDEHQVPYTLSFGEAVKRGVCVSPPAGVPKPADVVAELARLDAELFVIVEQDLYPCAPEVPLPIAVGTREHLAGCGLSGTRRPNVDR